MGDWRLIELEPLDVIGVRDGKPFDLGDAVRARSIFPPAPWSVLGAVRTLLLEQLGADPAVYGNRADDSASRKKLIDSVRSVVGDPDGAPGFELGPVLVGCGGSGGTAEVVFGAENGARGSVLFPPPMDLGFAHDDGSQERMSLVRLRRMARPEGYACSSHAGSELLFAPGGARIVDDIDFWLTLAGMTSYLAGSLQMKLERRPEARPVVAEDTRIGIGLENKTVRDGYFYARQTMAMAPGWGLRVAVRPLNDDARKALSASRGIVRLGSDGHAARVGQAGEWKWPAPVGNLGGRAALYFASPVAIEDATDQRLSELAGGSVSILARATRRAMPLGGWKLGVGPRDMRRYLPAGTVLLVSSQGGELSRLHAVSVAAGELERCAGFGFALLGKLEG